MFISIANKSVRNGFGAIEFRRGCEFRETKTKHMRALVWCTRRDLPLLPSQLKVVLHAVILCNLRITSFFACLCIWILAYQRFNFSLIQSHLAILLLAFDLLVVYAYRSTMQDCENESCERLSTRFTVEPHFVVGNHTSVTCEPTEKERGALLRWSCQSCLCQTEERTKSIQTGDS